MLRCCFVIPTRTVSRGWVRWVECRKLQHYIWRCKMKSEVKKLNESERQRTSHFFPPSAASEKRKICHKTSVKHFSLEDSREFDFHFVSVLLNTHRSGDGSQNTLRRGMRMMENEKFDIVSVSWQEEKNAERNWRLIPSFTFPSHVLHQYEWAARSESRCAIKALNFCQTFLWLRCEGKEATDMSMMPSCHQYSNVCWLLLGCSRSSSSDDKQIWDDDDDDCV